MAVKPNCFPYGPMLPLVPGVILLLGLIFTIIGPNCRRTSTVAIVLGVISVMLVLLPASIQFNTTSQIKYIFIAASIFSVINLIMEALCRTSWSNWVAVAFWALGAIVTAYFAFNPNKVIAESEAHATNRTNTTSLNA